MDTVSATVSSASSFASFASRVLVIVVALAAAACTNNHPLPPRAAALNRDGAIALAAGDLATAEARLALAIEYSPRFVEAYVNLGLVELRRGNLDLAYAHFKKARDLNPDLKPRFPASPCRAPAPSCLRPPQQLGRHKASICDCP